ncbi:MAG TPA: toll/interleukin-1 receptor domain-containing protein [Actinocrinis sp.]|nr:toll/interleukin-1 receptor domain-containing protein [Actinocrinis sp.]
MTRSVAGFFWSYTHLDNEYDHGRILRLAELIKREYAIRTRQELDIFVDRTHIGWGEDWRERLNVALGGTTFFIPIITPGYLNSAECRRELLMFAGHSTSLGRQELILPILYVDTPALDLEDSRDEVVSLIKRTQREDWRRLRFEAEDSPDHRRAISRIVNRLLEISAGIDLPGDPGRHAEVGPNSFDSPSDIDIIAELEQAIPKWGHLLKSIYDTTLQIDAVNERAVGILQNENLDFSSGAASAKVAALRRYAESLEQPVRDILNLASEFASEAIRLDPDVLTLVRAAEQSNPAADFVEYSCELILAITPRLRQNVGVIRDYIGAMSRLASASRVLRPPVATAVTAMQQITDGFERIAEWERRIGDTGREAPDLPGLDDE